MEAYVKGERIEQPELFLPWKEFVERCRAYDVNLDDLIRKKAYPDFLSELAQILPEKIRLYLISGENMRIKGMKQATKDIDVVTTGSNSEAHTLFNSLVKMRYRRLKSEITKSERELNPIGIFKHPEHPR